MKQGRNASCHCGSGKKVKKCCHAGIDTKTRNGTDKLNCGAKHSPSKELISQLVTLFNEGHFAEAEHQARLLTEKYINSGVAWKVLSVFLQVQEKDAIDALQKTADLLSDDAEAHNNLGKALAERGQLHEALQHCQHAIKINPNYADAYISVGNALQNLNQIDAAISSYHQALSINPDALIAHDNLLFALNYHPDLTAEEIFQSYQEYDALIGLPLRSTWKPYSNDRNPSRRLRVGYVSPDFRKHSSNSFLEPLLSGHDKTKIETYAYAELNKEDELTARYKDIVDHWIPTKHMNDEVLAEKIRSDKIDILVDLAGHTTGNRLAVFARKPAPVSLSTIGFGYTTGLSAIDYFVADETLFPDGCEALFSEKLWRIKTPAFPYLPSPGMGDVNDLPALQNGYITFGTLSRSVRINHRTIRVWAKLLNKVPDSKLVIDSLNFKDAQMQEKLAGQFSAHGITRDRLLIGYHTPPWDLLRSIDISLDCFPHNSGTTLMESLYMGVPFITLADRPSVGRIGSVVLISAGHPEWIANNEADYVDKAVKLATNLEQLSVHRAELREELERTILSDASGFVGKMEDSYQQMWQRWCANSLEDTLSTIQPELTQLTENQMPTEICSNKSIEQEIEDALHQAITQHQNGQLQGAMDLYLAILQVNPHHADANHNMGVLALQQNLFEDSLPYFLAALDANPTHGLYWTSYIDALIRSKKLEEASQFLTLAQEQGLPAEDVAALSIQLSNQRTGQIEQKKTHHPSQQQYLTTGKNHAPRLTNRQITLNLTRLKSINLFHCSINASTQKPVSWLLR